MASLFLSLSLSLSVCVVCVCVCVCVCEVTHVFLHAVFGGVVSNDMTLRRTFIV